MKDTARALALLMAMSLTGCLGTILSSTTDAAMSVAKAPFKVAGAAADIASGD
jgi:hypothetical protein